MDSILNAQLERMEAALGQLLSSIITYNPSVPAADQLLQADDELYKGLEQCLSPILTKAGLPLLIGFNQ